MADLMNSMMVTIPAGILILLVLYGLFYRFSPLNAKQASLVISLLALVFYLPLALLYWPGADVLAMNITVYFMVAYLLGMFFTHRERQLQGGQAGGKWFHWAPALIVSFFVIVLLIDAVFVTISREGLPEALEKVVLPADQEQVRTNFPGVMHNNYHKKEAKYNQYLRQQEKLRELGWKVRQGWLGGVPQAGSKATFQFMIEDAKGEKIARLQIKGRLMRAADGRDDILFTMNEATPGIYQAELTLAYPGLWHMNLGLLHGSERFELQASTTIMRAE